MEHFDRLGSANWFARFLIVFFLAGNPVRSMASIESVVNQDHAEKHELCGPVQTWIYEYVLTAERTVRQQPECERCQKIYDLMIGILMEIGWEPSRFYWPQNKWDQFDQDLKAILRDVNNRNLPKHEAVLVEELGHILENLELAHLSRMSSVGLFRGCLSDENMAYIMEQHSDQLELKHIVCEGDGARFQTVNFWSSWFQDHGGVIVTPIEPRHCFEFYAPTHERLGEMKTYLVSVSYPHVIFGRETEKYELREYFSHNGNLVLQKHETIK